MIENRLWIRSQHRQLIDSRANPLVVIRHPFLIYILHKPVRRPFPLFLLMLKSIAVDRMVIVRG